MLPRQVYEPHARFDTWDSWRDDRRGSFVLNARSWPTVADIAEADAVGATDAIARVRRGEVVYLGIGDTR
jgi:hypothetical protein